MLDLQEGKCQFNPVPNIILTVFLLLAILVFFPFKNVLCCYNDIHSFSLWPAYIRNETYGV